MHNAALFTSKENSEVCEFKFSADFATSFHNASSSMALGPDHLDKLTH